MIKNIFVFFMTFVMTMSASIAQVPSYNLKADLLVPSREELVTKPRTTSVVIKERFREDSFILKGEAAKHQGYVLTIQDRKIIVGILERCERSCGSLVDSVGKSCDEELSECQKDCDDRIKLVEDRNEVLLIEKANLKKELKSESNKKIIFAGISAFAGFGLGAFFMTIAK